MRARIVGAVTDIAPFAAVARARFGDPGVHAVVRSGRTVHAVHLGRWIGSEFAPELVCHTGVSGWSPAVLEPTRAQVTCTRCLRRIDPRPTEDDQLQLFGEAGLPPS